MQLEASGAVRNLPKLGTVTAVSTLALLTPTPAYAISLDGIISTVTTSPWGMFGVGCAAGAIVGGLVFGIAGSSAKHRLYEEIEEISAEAQRAQNSAELYRTRYESLSAQLKRSYVPTATVQQRAAEQRQAAAAQQRYAYARPTYAQPTATGSVSSQATTGSLPRQPQHQAPAQDTSQLRGRASASAARTQDKPSASVRDTLRRRLSSDSLNDTFTIDRGQAVKRPVTMDERFPGLSGTQGGVGRAGMVGSVPGATATGASTTASLTATNRLGITRASIISKRVPSIDASLYPDNTQISYAQTDMFEAALSAMDENLRREQETQRRAAAMASQRRVADAASQQRAAAHVEDLVREEMERNRRAAEGDLSSRFTVYDGTGDLGAARGRAAEQTVTTRQAASKRKAQHLSPMTKEA